MKSELQYFIDLVHAGMDGASSAGRVNDIPPVWRPAWTAAALGAALGATTASIDRKSRTGSGMAKGALFGSVLGLGCGAAWASRRFTRALAQGARRKIDTARDARWLEKNPIDYA